MSIELDIEIDFNDYYDAVDVSRHEDLQVQVLAEVSLIDGEIILESWRAWLFNGDQEISSDFDGGTRAGHEYIEREINRYIDRKINEILDGLQEPEEIESTF